MEAEIPEAKTRVRPRCAGSPVPLTAWQRYLWNAYSPNNLLSDMRRCDASLSIRGRLDEKRLRRCIQIVAERHDALRTRIAVIDGTPRLQCDDTFDHGLELIDLTVGSATGVEERAKQFYEEFQSERIDWKLHRLFASKLLRLSEFSHLLLIGIDHMVTDGTSSGIIRREISTWYQRGSAATQVTSPATSVQFSDYAVWQQKTFQAWRDKHELYWLERLTNLPKMELPFDGFSSAHPNFRWKRTEFSLGRELSSQLRILALRRRMLLPLVVLGLISAVMARWCSQPRWAVDFVSHGRHAHPELANTVGFLTTLLQLQFEVRDDESLLGLVKRVHEDYWAALSHQDYGRLPDCMPQYTAPMSFNWASTNWTRPPSSPTGANADQVQFLPFSPRNASGFLHAPWRKLSILILPDDEDTAAGLVIGLGHMEHLLTSRTIERLCQSIQLVAEKFTADPLIMQRSLQLPL